MEKFEHIFFIIIFSLSLDGISSYCELPFSLMKKRTMISIEEATLRSPIVFRGTSVINPFDIRNKDENSTIIASFELLNIFKGSDAFQERDNFRIVNVTLTVDNVGSRDCKNEFFRIPQEYIVFGFTDDNGIVAVSTIKWNEKSEQKVWMVLGWSQWSDWSSCSVSCSSGIQQRIRHCSKSEGCPGHNIEQRLCNIFECDRTINPLFLKNDHFYHPSRDKWKMATDRLAWKMEPYNYLWVPSVFLLNSRNITQFPKEFSVFFTVRLHENSSGTLMSLRSRIEQTSYISIEVRKNDLKLSHASSENGSDTLVIPVDLEDYHNWHQIAISFRQGNIVDCFVNCEWIQTVFMKNRAMEIPDDFDLIIGYLFSGDVEQVSFVSDPEVASLQCSKSKTPITDQTIKFP